jgi:hypothetical protein
MTSALPEHDEFMELMRDTIAGKNTLHAKHFTVEITATRQSGEMNTSLGNGFSNLMFLLFVAEKLGATEVRAVIEGDDGLSWMNSAESPTAKHFADLGLIIKLEPTLTLEQAAFCGLIFDSEALANVTDPSVELASFGWCSARYARSNRKTKMALLRCKGLSLAHQYSGCPIISALARYSLRVTRSYNIQSKVKNWRNTYEREQMMDALACPPAFVEPDMKTRMLVFTVYGIDLDVQYQIEKYLDEKDDLELLDHWAIRSLMKPVWMHYWDHYCGSAIELQSRLYPRVPEFFQLIPLFDPISPRVFSGTLPVSQNELA